MHGTATRGAETGLETGGESRVPSQQQSLTRTRHRLTVTPPDAGAGAEYGFKTAPKSEIKKSEHGALSCTVVELALHTPRQRNAWHPYRERNTITCAGGYAL